MKSASLKYVAALAMLSLMALTPLSTAQSKNTKHHHYKFIDLGTLDGPTSRNDGIWPAMNNRGTVIGAADTNTPDPFYPNVNPLIEPATGSDPYIFHAFAANNSQLVALDSLPGGYKTWPSAISETGLISGEAINGALDPIAGWPEENAVLWLDGEIINLGTLGGYESGAGQVNSRGQVTGFSGNAIPDPYSIIYFLFTGGLFSNGTQTRAFLWDKKNGLQDIGTLGGPDSFAPFINESGQIAGFSYINNTPNPTTGVPTVDPFLWENGTMIDLGSLGGTSGGEGDGIALNNHGQVVGSSNLAGDVYSHPFLWSKPGPMRDLGTFGGNFGTANAVNDVGEVVGWATNTGDQALLAFFWTNGTLTNLGTLPGYLCSYAHIVNSKHQVLGDSDDDCNGGNDHGFLWENGSMVDLNSLVTGADMTLGFPTAINARGEIAGIGLLANGNTHAYLLIPCDESHPDVEGCDYSMVEASAAVAGDARPAPAMQLHPETKIPSVRQMLRRRMPPLWRLPHSTDVGR